MCLFVLVCVVLLVASELGSVRWLLCGGNGSKNEKKKKNDICNFKKKKSREGICPHWVKKSCLGTKKRDHVRFRRLCIRSFVSALKSSLLCLLTTHDTAGSGQISSAKMKDHREMSRLVSRSQAKRSM